MCLPRPCRGLVRGRGSRKSGVRQPMAKHIPHGGLKAALVIHVLAVVVTEALLIEVAKQMERFDAHIGTVYTALQQRPEVFEAVRVDATVHVLYGVVHDLMRVVAGETLIRKQEVRVQRRPRLYMLLNLRLQGVLLTIRHNGRNNLTATLQHAHHSNLVTRTATSDATLALGNVHVPRLAADKRLIRFDLTRKRCRGVVMHRHADAVKHEPCRLLSDTQRACNLAGANAVLAIADNPERTHPLIESERRILKDRANFKRELFLAALAVPQFARLYKGVLIRATAWASNYAIRKAESLSVLKGTVRIREVNDGLLKCMRRFHDLRIGRNALCVTYVIALRRAKPAGRSVSIHSDPVYLGGKTGPLKTWPGST